MMLGHLHVHNGHPDMYPMLSEAFVEEQKQSQTYKVYGDAIKITIRKHDPFLLVQNNDYVE